MKKNIVYLILKRIGDIVISFFIIIITIPFLIIIGIAVKLDSNGPIIFKQKRNGLYGKEFNLYKIRTMYICQDVLSNTSRTNVGKFLRKYYLDEIPQMINILKGDMSLIGPRPWVIEKYPYYTERQKQRFMVQPGITGLAQVKGGKLINITDRIEYDIKYVENMSLILDLKILWKTIIQIIEHKDSSGKGLTVLEEIEELKEANKKYIKEGE